MSDAIGNTKGRIAELRKRISANKRIAKRARNSAWDLTKEALSAEEQIALDQCEINAMVRRFAHD